jgi:hypothetical protein
MSAEDDFCSDSGEWLEQAGNDDASVYHPHWCTCASCKGIPPPSPLEFKSRRKEVK